MNESQPFDLSVQATVRPRRRKWLVIATLLLVPIGLLLGGYAYLLRQADQELQEAIAEADRLEPDGWRLEELLAKRTVFPEERNSANAVIAARRLLPQGWPDWDWPPPSAEEKMRTELLALQESFRNLEPAEQLSEVLIAALKREMPRAAAALVEARKLADLPEGRHPVTYAPDFVSTLLPTIQGTREVAELLKYDALVRAQEKDIDGALTSCRAIVNTGRSIGDEPGFIAMLVRIAIRMIAVSQIERTLAQGEPSEEALAALQQFLEKEEQEPLLLIAMRGERAGMDMAIQSLQTGTNTVGGLAGGPPSRGIGDLLPLIVPGFITKNRAANIRYMNRVVEIAKLPIEQQVPQIDQLETTLKDQPLFVRLSAPAVSKVAAAFQRSQAQLRVTITALAAERYRQQHGRWPDTLAVLVQTGYLRAVPTDPYDGQPLRLRRQADGLIVYTIGPDQTDDGGKLNRKNYQAKGSDLGFQLWDVTRRRQPPPEPLPPPRVEGEPLGLPPFDNH